MTFTSISIANFRGIRSFTCERLARVTLIVGRNNCGKTSLLEAFMALANRRTAQILPILNNTRQLSTTRVTDLDVAFLDPAKPLSIQAMDSEGLCRSVTIARMAEAESTFNAEQKEITPEQHYRLEQTFQDVRSGKAPVTGCVRFTEEPNGDSWSLSYETANNGTEKSFTDPLLLFLPTQGFDIMPKKLTQLFMERAEHILVTPLQKFDSRIQSVRLIDGKIMIGLEGQPRLLPFQVLGDGAFRLFALLSALWVCRGGCVCIDEIDNGLHNSVQPLVWEMLIRYAQEWDVQIIATSHHLDLLQAINTVYKNNPDAIPPQDFAYIVLSREGDAIHPLAFDLTALSSALDLGLEVR